LKFISTTLFPFLSAEDTSRKEGAVDISDTAPFVDFSNIPIFNPETRVDFENLCETLVPVIRQNYRKEDYVPFLQDFAKLLAEDLPGEQIKKIASMLTAFSNEKAKMEKVAERHGKKGKEKNKMSWVMVSNYEVTSEM
jgi:translation initiation factor 3 subunit J